MRMTGSLLAGLVMAMTPLCLADDKKPDDKKADGANVTCGKVVVKDGTATIPFTMRLGKADKSCKGVSPMVVPEGKEADWFQAFVNMFAPKPGTETTKSYAFFTVTSGKSYEVRISMMYLDAAGETKYTKGTVKFKAP